MPRRPRSGQADRVPTVPPPAERPSGTGVHDVISHAVDELARLLDVDGAMAYLVEAGGQQLRFVADAGIRHPEVRALVRDLVLPIGVGLFGTAAERKEVVVTADYRHDERFRHSPVTDRIVMLANMRSMAVAPLVADGEALGGIGAYSSRIDAFEPAQIGLLRALADHAAVAIANAQLAARLRESEASLRAQAEELAQRVEAQRALAEIAARITAIHDPGDVLQRTLDEAVRLLDADGGRIELIDSAGGLRWAFGHSAIDLPIELVEPEGTARPAGVAALAVRERRVVNTPDYLIDRSFDHDEGADRYIRQHGVRSVISAPIVGEEGAIGALTVHAQEPGAFGAQDAQLLELLASGAAIAVTNARLYERLRSRIDAQQSLAEIAAEIAALHDPQSVIQRSVADAARLLDAERAQVNLVSDAGDHLDPPIAAAPEPPSADDVPVPIGSGIAGMAAAQRVVRWTGDYLADSSFPHDEGDARIRGQGIRSMMAAPLMGPDELIGTITVQSRRRAAFEADDAQLLKLLADQAAIALINARLYDELQQSETRYRFLVDNSPDIVWSVDAGGRFTFLSDSLETRTGWKPEQLLGQPFQVLTEASSREAAVIAWERVRANPGVEQRLRLDLPLADGQTASVEVAMAGTVVDGRFAGAHGSVRDISEREQLEADLRRQAAELAANEERAHLARELHDSVTQALFSMGLTVRSIELLLETDPVAARAKIEELRGLQRDALAEMRTLIFELRPASLATDGLAQALRTHAAAVQGRTGLSINVDTADVERLPLPVEEALYRIGQEALHNVVKHANASRATIRLERKGTFVLLSVADDGAGFDPDSVPRGHLGLVGMRQRADLVGARLAVHSQPDAGTRVEVSIDASRTDGGRPNDVGAGATSGP